MILLHPLTNDSVYSWNNLPNIAGTVPVVNNGAYAINLDESDDIGTHWGVIYSNNDKVCFYSLVLNLFQKE